MTHTLAILPQPKGRPRFTRQGHAYTPTKTRHYEEDLRIMLAVECPAPLEGALSLDVRFLLPRPKSTKRPAPTVKPDLDNLLKAFLDAANGILWADDAQLLAVVAEKAYADSPEGAGILFRVEEVER